jgi:hypothetical protein
MQGLTTDEVAARVSFTVETTVLLSFALSRGSWIWEGPSSSHDPFFSCEAALSYSKVGMPRRRRPKFQLRSGVHAGDAMAAVPRKWVSGGAPTLPFDARAHGVALFIDEVAARVSFTVETTVLPSFALPRGACSGVSMSAGCG